MSNNEMLAGFRSPDKSCSQIPFWFLNGPVDGREWSGQIREMASKGVHQAMPHPRYGMDRRDYLNDKYWGAFSELVKTAEEIGFTLHLYDEFNWSSGPVAGKVTERREFRALGLAMRERVVDGPTTVVFDEWTKGFQDWGKPERILDAVVVPLDGGGEMNLNEAKRLTVPDGHVSTYEATVPKGKWRVMVFYLVRTTHPSPLRMGNGGVINYLSAAATDRFLELTHDEYARRYGHLFGGLIPSIFYDEVGPYACGAFTWTDDLPEQFLAKKGHDILNSLPLLFHDGGALSEKTRCDYWDVVSDLFVERFVGRIAAWCEAHHLALTGHNYETSNAFMLSGNLFKIQRSQQWVGFDSLGQRQPFATLKVPISVAHVRGQSVVLCECLGCMGGWEASPRMARAGYNRLAMAGVTHFVPHGFFQTVDSPKVECPPTFFKDVPYWKYYDQIAALTSRMAHINRQGVHVADAAVFYPIVSWWGDSAGGRGSTLPWRVDGWNACQARESCETFDAIIETLVTNQIDLDVLDGIALAGAEERDGKFSLAGETYRLLALPPTRTVKVEDLRHVLRLAENGVPVVTVGRLPEASMENGRDDPELKTLVDELAKRTRLVSTPEELPDAIREMIEPDVTLVEGNPDHVLVSHRRIGADDVYFICDTSGAPHRVRLRMRAQGHASLWNPADGSIHSIDARKIDGGTEADVFLGPDEGAYLVLGERQLSADPALARILKTPDSAHSLDGPWRFIPVPKALEIKWTSEIAPEQELESPCFKTTTVRRGVAFNWNDWFKNDLDDGDWDVVHCLREPLLYDDVDSRFFRAPIPDCAVAVKLPLPIEKEHALYLNGELTRVVTEHMESESGWLEIPGNGDCGRILAIECASMAPRFGVTGPITYKCAFQETNLRSWTEVGLAWHTGRCFYKKTFVMGADVKRKSRRVFLDLGDVRECAEIWINGTLTGTRIWPPYRVEATPLLKEGKNDLTIVVSNLPANMYAWDEWGSRGGGRPLPSGLLGPVTLEFLDA